MNDTVIDQWNKAADSYAGEQERSAFAAANRTVVKNRFKNLAGKTVLDLGCGYGYYTDYFGSISGNVIGIDGSQTMINLAKRKYPNSRFFLSDLNEPLPYEKDSFDLVFCNQVLMDIENITELISECRRVLRPEGTFYYSIVHPAFYIGDWINDANGRKRGKVITSYITPFKSENSFWGKTTHFHRPLSYYLNAASDAGLVLVHCEEPKTYDALSKNDELPLFFFAEYRKPG